MLNRNYPPLSLYRSMEQYRQMFGNGNGYIKDLLSSLVGKKVNILLNGREGIFENLTINAVEDDVVISETEKEICVIPIKFIATVFMSKELAEEVL